MPPDGPSPEDPREWVRRARSNLARASQGRFSPDVLREDVCFDARQAVEKALKALLVSRGVRVPRTHAIGELITVLCWRRWVSTSLQMSRMGRH
jgi:HEPN domain-containing protein